MTDVTDLFRILIVRKPQKTANVTDVTLVTFIRSIGPKVELRFNYMGLLAVPTRLIKTRTHNPMESNTNSTIIRCGAKTRSGGRCRTPVVKGRSRCRMHGGTNPGAPKGNRNAYRHGNRSAEAAAQLKLVRQANRDLRIRSKISRGIDLTVRERDRLLELFAEQYPRTLKTDDTLS